MSALNDLWNLAFGCWSATLIALLTTTYAQMNFWLRVQDDEARRRLAPVLRSIAEKILRSTMSPPQLLQQLQKQGVRLTRSRLTLFSAEPPEVELEGAALIMAAVAASPTTTPSADELVSLLSTNHLRVTTNPDQVDAIEAARAWLALLPFGSFLLLAVSFVVRLQVPGSGPLSQALGTALELPPLLSLGCSALSLLGVLLLGAGLRGYSALHDLLLPPVT